jgi:hypothetical protein
MLHRCLRVVLPRDSFLSISQTDVNVSFSKASYVNQSEKESFSVCNLAIPTYFMTDSGLDDSGSIPNRHKRFFSYPFSPDRLWDPPAQRVLQKPSPEAKRPGREANLSPPPAAGVRIEWSYTSTTPYVFIECCLISKYQVQLCVNRILYFRTE